MMSKKTKLNRMNTSPIAVIRILPDFNRSFNLEKRHNIQELKNIHDV